MTQDQDERPVHVNIDCTTGAVTHTALTDQEIADMKLRDDAAATEYDRRMADEQQLRDSVADHPDPVVQALAKRAGLA